MPLVSSTNLILWTRLRWGAEVAIFGKWDQKKSAVTGMKVLAQVEDDMQPVYHVAQGVSQAQLIKAIRQLLMWGLEFMEESLPQVLLDKYRLMGHQEAVRAMHFRKIWLNISRLYVGPSLRSSFISDELTGAEG